MVMDFFGMGMGEILLVLVIALIIWGPGKLPEIARTLGKTVRAIRKASADLTTTVTRELEEKEPPPAQIKEESSAETRKTPSAASKASSPGQDDPTTKLKKT